MNPAIQLSRRWEVALITDLMYGDRCGKVTILEYQDKFFPPSWREIDTVATTDLFDCLYKHMGYPLPDDKRQEAITTLRQQWRDRVKI